MHFSAVTLFAALAAAQTSVLSASSPANTAGTSGCGQQIDNIIALCLQTTQAQLNACATNDWSCYCTQQTNVMTCYNNCPADPARNAAEGQLTSWCNAAKQYSSSTTSAAAVSASTSAAAKTSGATATKASGTASASATAAATGAAVANVILPAGGALAAVFGLAALI